MAQNTNNSGVVRLPRWVAIILLSTFFGIFGFFLRGLYAQVQEQGKDIVTLKQANAVTEVRYVEIKEQLADIKALIKAQASKR